MATLVLSTIGTALGGPVGSAIGALIGQSIDQELLAPTRRGPRLGDLAVQTSSYGTQIARVYGCMRVAGTVIWATDLVEHADSGGAKGQPDVTYSYTVSLAVALSSRCAKSVKRIWADGKLIRGSAGDFKVGTTFRFHDGSEDQVVDPLIASLEGIGHAPAYRGLAMAVFEDLELAEFGNRIPFLTFELEADEVAPTTGLVLGDASEGAISCDAEQSIAGFAAYGASTKSAIQPLVDAFDVPLFDDGTVLRSPTSGAALTVAEDELGCRANSDNAPRLHREQLPVRSVPAALRLSYYDVGRDYQTGEARAVAGEQSGSEAQQELAAVLSAADAKSLAQQMLARAWSKRDKLTLRLAPGRLPVEPGSRLELPFDPPIWTVESTTVDGFVAVVQLTPSTSGNVTVQADGGRIVPNMDVVTGEIRLALLDLPNVLVLPSNEPSVIVAASTPTAGWKQRTLTLDFGAQSISAQTARAKSVLGNALTPLAPCTADLIDGQNSVDIELLDVDQWLTSCDDDALAGGANLAALGKELIQFGIALPLAPGRFRLSRLLRGRGGTEWACGGHSAGEVFCVIQPATLQSITLPSAVMGASVSASVAGGAVESIVFSAECLRPPSPVNFSAQPQSSGDLLLSWTRRSRLGFAWVDEIDAPLGETREQYRIDVEGALAALELLVDQPTATLAAADLASLGAGPLTIAVRQVGDLAVSRPTQLTITLSQE